MTADPEPGSGAPGDAATPVPLADEPLARVADHLRSRALDPHRYAQSLLERAERIDPVIHALVDEHDRARRVHAEIDALPPGDAPLFAVPLGVKDIFRVDGLPTRAGSRLPPDLLGGPEATCVRALRDAGAVVLAKAVTAEFAFFDPGSTRNPHDVEHTPGGSSSGSAAGVAAGFFPVALGTQTIGSVIRPAAFCGVVGFKPSFGRIPTEGVIPCSPSADTVGLFTQDLPGMRLAAAATCTGWREYTDQGPPPVLGVPEGPYLECAARDGLDAFASHLTALESSGLRVVRVACLDHHADVVTRHRRMVLAEMAAVHDEWFQAHGDAYGPGIAAGIRQGRQVSDAEVQASRRGRLDLRAELVSTMDAVGVDVWVCPAAPGPAPHGITSTGDPIMNLAWTHAGLPAVTVPAGMVGHLPVGVQCVARFGADESLLGWALHVAAAVRAR